MRKLGLALLSLLCLGLGYALVRAQPVTMPPPPGTSATLCVFNTVLPTMNSGFPGYIQCDINGRSLTSPGSAGAAGYPNGSTPFTVSGVGTTGSFTLTMPAIAAKTAYVCGFFDDVVATAATGGNTTLTGVSGGTMTFIQPIGTLATSNTGHYVMNWAPCIPASAVNTQIQFTTVAPGAGGIQDASLWGFYL